MSDKIFFPHISHSTAAVNKYEPIVGSNFHAQIVLMGQLKDKLGDYSFLSEYIASVGGAFAEKSGGTIDAYHKQFTATYDSNEKVNKNEIEVVFHNFLDEQSRSFVYNSMVAWSRVKYNPLTGHKSLKSLYADACLITERYNRDGSIFLRRIYHNIFPANDIDDLEADYANHDVQDFTITFNSDLFLEITNDPRLILAQ